VRCAGFPVSQAALAQGTAAVDALVEQLVQRDIACLQAQSAPPLYRAGVPYREEPLGQEYFHTVADARARGHADCDALAAWRVAELRMMGVPARAFSVVGRDRYGVVYHVLVWTPWGVEDPSRLLGMR
jgi:hypothetical protein